MAAKKSAKKGPEAQGRTVFRLVLDPDATRVRRKTAPPVRPMTPAQLKKPRRREDFLALAQDK